MHLGERVFLGCILVSKYKAYKGRTTSIELNVKCKEVYHEKEFQSIQSLTQEIFILIQMSHFQD